MDFDAAVLAVHENERAGGIAPAKVTGVKAAHSVFGRVQGEFLRGESFVAPVTGREIPAANHNFTDFVAGNLAAMFIAQKNFNAGGGPANGKFSAFQAVFVIEAAMRDVTGFR